MPCHAIPSLPYSSIWCTFRKGNSSGVGKQCGPMCSYPPTYMLLRSLLGDGHQHHRPVSCKNLLLREPWVIPHLTSHLRVHFSKPQPDHRLYDVWASSRNLNLAHWKPGGWQHASWANQIGVRDPLTTLLLLPSEMEPTCGLQKERSGSAFTLKHVVAPIVTLWCWIWSLFCVLLAKSRVREIFTWVL
jgi:hypothetical protein